MRNELMVFQNQEFGEVRSVMINGEPWFVGKDVTSILGYSNPSKALTDHVDSEDKLNNDSLSSLGQRGGWVINESGLYSLILSSKLPNAKKFKKWVTGEVLPSIRKTGKYEHNNTPKNDTFKGDGKFKVRIYASSSGAVEYLVDNDKVYINPYSIDRSSRAISGRLKKIEDEYIYRMDKSESNRLGFEWFYKRQVDKHLTFLNIEKLGLLIKAKDPNHKLRLFYQYYVNDGKKELIDEINLIRYRMARDMGTEQPSNLKKFYGTTVCTLSDLCMAIGKPMEYVYYALSNIEREQILLQGSQVDKFVKENNLPQPRIKVMEILDYASCIKVANMFSERKLLIEKVDALFEMCRVKQDIHPDAAKCIEQANMLANIRSRCKDKAEKMLLESIIDTCMATTNIWNDRVFGFGDELSDEYDGTTFKDKTLMDAYELAKTGISPTIKNIALSTNDSILCLTTGTYEDRKLIAG